MTPEQTGKAYDRITDLWVRKSFNRNNGVDAHRRALAFAPNSGRALDVGCGCTGRFIDLLLDANYEPEGVDVSEQMLKLARMRNPDIPFSCADIRHWKITRRYDFVTAWDSIWHVPLNQQTAVVLKLVDCLRPGGVLIFSFGGTDEAGEHTDDAMGPEVYYASLGTKGFLSLLLSAGCVIRHLEYDQHPELHAYIVAENPGS